MMCWPATKRSWAVESICSFLRLTPDYTRGLPGAAAQIAVGDLCYVDIELGKEKLSLQTDSPSQSNNSPANASFILHTPDGGVCDLKRSALGQISVGSERQIEPCAANCCSHFGAAFSASQPGVYIADARFVSEHQITGKSVKCAKAIIGVTRASRGGLGLTGFDRAISQVLELIPLNDPTTLAVGDCLTVQVLFKGSPLPGVCVTVIPRGKILPRFGVETPYDVVTDGDGRATFTFEEPSYHLFVVHLKVDEDPTTERIASQETRYSGDLTVMVRPRPQRTPIEDPAPRQFVEPLVPVCS